MSLSNHPLALPCIDRQVRGIVGWFQQTKANSKHTALDDFDGDRGLGTGVTIHTPPQATVAKVGQSTGTNGVLSTPHVPYSRPASFLVVVLLQKREIKPTEVVSFNDL